MQQNVKERKKLDQEQISLEKQRKQLVCVVFNYKRNVELKKLNLKRKLDNKMKKK